MKIVLLRTCQLTYYFEPILEKSAKAGIFFNKKFFQLLSDAHKKVTSVQKTVASYRFRKSNGLIGQKYGDTNNRFLTITAFQFWQFLIQTISDQDIFRPDIFRFFCMKIGVLFQTLSNQTFADSDIFGFGHFPIKYQILSWFQVT